MSPISKVTALALATLSVALIATTTFAGPRGDDMGMRGNGGPFMGMDFATVDADKDGKITPAEIEAYRAARLTAADADADGFLSAEELQAMTLAQMQGRAAERAAKMIERQDRDGDGKLSLAEMTPPTPQERMFARMDTDKDGALSEAEMTAAKERMAARGEGRGGDRGEGRGKGHGGGNHGKGNVNGGDACQRAQGNN